MKKIVALVVIILLYSCTRYITPYQAAHPKSKFETTGHRRYK